MQKTNKLSYTITAIMFVVFFIISSLMGGGMGVTFAATSSTYSDVLVDLHKDSSFSESNYPAVANDYSLQVIQIAESENGELFIYVYQKDISRDLRATTVSISTAINDNLSHRFYGLTLINSSGVFFKYVVNGLTVKSDTVRYYDISEIFRAWDSDIDEELENGNTVSEVAYTVAQLWTACTIGDTVTYHMEETSVIQVTDKYVGVLRYSQGILFNVESSCDSHYIAFSTDMQIDDLQEATVYFVSQSYRYSYLSNTATYGSEVENYVKITSEEIVSSGTFGLFANVHLWSRIETVSDFMANVSLTDEAKNKVAGKQWVLRFVETEYTDVYGTGGGYTTSTLISDTAILELKFVSNGKCYKLGVVDNKQTGNSIDNTDTGFAFGSLKKDGCADWENVRIILAVLCFVLLIVVVLFVYKLLVSLFRKE